MCVVRKPASPAVGFNRYIVECKSVTSPAVDARPLDLIDT